MVVSEVIFSYVVRAFVRAVPTNEVVAIWYELSPAVAVGATGVPVNDGLAIVAYVESDVNAVATNFVVAILLELTPAVGVGPYAFVVKVGLSFGANNAIRVSKFPLLAVIPAANTKSPV